MINHVFVQLVQNNGKKIEIEKSKKHKFEKARKGVSSSSQIKIKNYFAKISNIFKPGFLPVP